MKIQEHKKLFVNGENFDRIKQYDLERGTVITNADDSEWVRIIQVISGSSVIEWGTTMNRVIESGILYKEERWV